MGVGSTVVSTKWRYQGSLYPVSFCMGEVGDDGGVQVLNSRKTWCGRVVARPRQVHVGDDLAAGEEDANG